MFWQGQVCVLRFATFFLLAQTVGFFHLCIEMCLRICSQIMIEVINTDIWTGLGAFKRAGVDNMSQEWIPVLPFSAWIQTSCSTTLNFFVSFLISLFVNYSQQWFSHQYVLAIIQQLFPLSRSTFTTRLWSGWIKYFCHHFKEEKEHVRRVWIVCCILTPNK